MSGHQMLKDATSLLLALLIGIVGCALCRAVILPIALYRTTQELGLEKRMMMSYELLQSDCSK